ASDARRLDEFRLEALEYRIEADLALERFAELVPELEVLVAEHPYREHLRAQLMLALYGAGRQAEALAAYRQARQTLVAELGIEPGERLRELQRQMLGHDPAIAGRPSPRLTAAPREERKIVTVFFADLVD